MLPFLSIIHLWYGWKSSNNLFCFGVTETQSPMFNKNSFSYLVIFSHYVKKNSCKPNKYLTISNSKFINRKTEINLY